MLVKHLLNSGVRLSQSWTCNSCFRVKWGPSRRRSACRRRSHSVVRSVRSQGVNICWDFTTRLFLCSEDPCTETSCSGPISLFLSGFVCWLFLVVFWAYGSVIVFFMGLILFLFPVIFPWLAPLCRPSPPTHTCSPFLSVTPSATLLAS